MDRMPKWLPIALAFMVGLLALSYFTGRNAPLQAPTVSYTEFKQLLADGRISAVEMTGSAITATLKQPARLDGAQQPVEHLRSRVPEVGDPQLLPTIEQHDVSLTAHQGEQGGWWSSLVFWGLLLAVYLWFWNRMYRNVAGGFGGKGMGDFLSGSSTAEDKGTPKVRFADVAGQDAAKAEVQELVELLRNPERYRRLGAEPPHGILLMGPPGTGKTLLAKALAGEAEVPFFHEAVVVLAATNRPDVLDPALLRPGRFDRHVTLDLPDRAARRAILKVHAARLPLAGDVDLDLIASATPGFSGADLKNLVNEAAMAAARDNSEQVLMRHFDATRDRLLMGTARAMVIQPEERHRLAVHESGHTACAHFLPNADPLYKVTIIPRGRALGGTHILPEEERHTLPEDYLKDRLAMMLGGRTAERLILGNVSSGADDDIRQATQLARAMVGRWGMSEEIGPVDLRESDEHPFLGREMALPRAFSDQTAHQVDDAVQHLLRAAEARAAEVIETHRPRIERLIARLEQDETLDRAAIDDCLGEAEVAPAARSAAGA
jgi:ATP-dependent Zn protease